jgi:hypothetical protein
MSAQPLVVPAMSGVLRVDRYFSYLRISDAAGGYREYLLLLHNSPSGALDAGTADFATSYLLHDLGKSDGQELTIWGFEGSSGSAPALAIIRAQ